MAPGGADADEQENRDRALRFARVLHGPTVASYRRSLRAVIIAVLFGIFIALVTREAVLAALATAAVATIGSVVAWSWLRRAADRRVFEIIRDHDDYERVEWRSANDGKARPRGTKAARRWLDANPGKPGTAVVLADLGRLDAARAALEAEEDAAPRMPFRARSTVAHSSSMPAAARRQRTCTTAGRPCPMARSAAMSVECLALLEAQVAIADGREPWPVVAAAGPEIGAVAPSMTTGWFAVSIAVVCLAATGFVGVVAVFIAR